MTAPVSAPSETAVSRIKDRRLYPWSHPRKAAESEAGSRLPAIIPRRPVGFPSSIAEFLLVFRLRVRRRSTLSADMLERAVQVVLVTCQQWFGTSDLLTHRSGRHD